MSYWKLDIPGVLSRLRAAHHENQLRRTARKDLSRFTDHQLRDIGIERRQISDVVDGMVKSGHVPATPPRQPEGTHPESWCMNTAAPCTQA